jgi:hypothetical protein
MVTFKKFHSPLGASATRYLGTCGARGRLTFLFGTCETHNFRLTRATHNNVRRVEFVNVDTVAYGIHRTDGTRMVTVVLETC